MNSRCDDLARDRAVSIPYYVRGLALGIPAYLIGVHLWTWVIMAPFYLGGHSDFRQLYAAAQMVRTGQAHRLYDPVAQDDAQNRFVGKDRIIPFVRPAYELLLFLPFTFFPYRAAYFLLLAVNLLLLFLIYRMLRPKMEHLAGIFPWLPAALFIAFLPIGIALLEGQDSLLLVLLFTAAYSCVDRGHEVAAGALAGLGMFKLQLAVPLALVFALWRRWDFVKGVLLTAIPAGVISVWMAGLTQTTFFIRLVLFMAQPVPNLSVYPLMTISRMMNFHGLVYLGLGDHASPRWIVIITAGASFALIAWLSRIHSSDANAFPLAIVASALLSYYLFFHDSSVLIIPLVVALDSFVSAEGSRNRNDGRTVFRWAAVLFTIPLLMSYFPKALSLAVVPLLGLLVSWHSYEARKKRSLCEGHPALNPR